MPYRSGYDTTLWGTKILLSNGMNFCGTLTVVTNCFKNAYKLRKFIHGYCVNNADADFLSTREKVLREGFSVSRHGFRFTGMEMKHTFITRHKRANASHQQPKARPDDGQQSATWQQTVMREYVCRNYGARFRSAACVC